jgi:hypothetical protein
VKINKLTKFTVISCTFFVIVFFFLKKESIIINPNDIKIIKHLDIIVTSGQSPQSKLLGLLNFTPKSFTHIGIICKNNNEVFVLHSTPDGTKENGIRYDGFQSFLDLSYVNYYEILRYNLTQEDTFIIEKTIKLYKTNKFPFDYNFNNFDKDKIYCSELVYEVFRNCKFFKKHINLSKPIHPKVFRTMNELNIIAKRSSRAN